MAYPVVNIGTLAAEDVNSLVKNAQSTSALPNGSLIVLGALISGQNGVFTASTPTSVTTQEVLLVRSPEIVEINGYRIDVTDPTLFTNPANVPFTAYHLKVGDTLTITDDGINGTSVQNQYIVPANNAILPVPAVDLSGGTLLAFQVIDKPTISVGQTRKAATRLLVVKSQ